MSSDRYSKLEGAFYNTLLAISRKRRIDHVRYVDMIDKFELTSIEAYIRKQRLLYAGRLIRMDNSRLPKIIFFSDIQGQRRKGPPTKTWRDNVKDDLDKFGIDKSTWMEKAKNEESWKKAVEEGRDRFEVKWKWDKEVAKSKLSLYLSHNRKRKRPYELYTSIRKKKAIATLTTRTTKKRPKITKITLSPGTIHARNRRLVQNYIIAFALGKGKRKGVLDRHHLNTTKQRRVPGGEL
jgi:hypothetical protein